MNREDRYAIGFSDPRMNHGDPNIKWEPIKASRRYDYGYAFAVVLLAVCVSMTVAPMAWVQLISWVLA